jgi:hypothetical protein
VTEANALAVALMSSERDLFVSLLRLAEEIDADRAATRPLLELLERALTVREARRAVVGMTT